MDTNNFFDRRKFVAGAAISTAATALTARAYSQVAGANDRVNIGILGFGLIGRIHGRSFAGLKEARIAAVSDAFKPRMEACKEIEPNVKTHADFRKLLESKDVDAVVVATPDHWHALQTQQRSAPHYQKAKELLRNGAIGDIASVQCDFFRNVMPGIGSPSDGDSPADFDWEMHLGPAPARRYNPNRSIYHFRWFWDTAGGQMTNLGHHSLDIVHWMFDIQGPKTVASHDGRWFLKDNGETPDTQNAIIEYDKFPAVVQFREAAGGGGESSMGSLVFIGTKGTMKLGRDGFEILPDKKENPQNIFAAIIGGHPVGGPQTVDEPKGMKWCNPMSDKSGNATQQYSLHAQNFIDCIKSRKTPNSDLESSHWVSTTCHLANISLKTGRKLSWGAAVNDILADKEASAMLERTYREPWAKELRSLLT